MKNAPNLCVALPCHGGADIAKEIAGTLFCFGQQLDALTVEGSLTSDGPAFFGGHLVHARSELIHRFLEHPRRYTHLLFWDTDVIVKPSVFAPLVSKLLKTGHDLVSVPYPQKFLHWRELNPGDPKGSTVWYVPDFREIPRGPIGRDDCAEMPRVPIGFALMRRAMLERMTDCYREQLSYYCKNSLEPDRPAERIVALFQFEVAELDSAGRVRPGIPTLPGEDYAFIDRWRKIGGKSHIYLGPEAPLGHRGQHVFEGSNAAIRRDYGAGA